MRGTKPVKLSGTGHRAFSSDASVALISDTSVSLPTDPLIAQTETEHLSIECRGRQN